MRRRKMVDFCGKRWGSIDTGVDDIHDYRVSGNRNHSGQIINDRLVKHITYNHSRRTIRTRKISFG